MYFFVDFMLIIFHVKYTKTYWDMVYFIKGCSKDEELLIEADSFHACMPYSMQYLQYLTGCSKTRNVLFMRGD